VSGLAAKPEDAPEAGSLPRLCTVALVCMPTSAMAQNLSPEELQKLATRLDSLESQNKTFRFGISIGPRFSVEAGDIRERRQPSISPGDSTLQFDSVDQVEINLAGVAAAYPFKSASGFWRWTRGVGFLAKLNLADFGPDSYVVNSEIEGGFGLSFAIGKSFAIAATYERVAGRRLRSHFDEGAQVLVDGVVQTSLDVDSDVLFVDDNFSTFGVSWVYSF
ncbi:MAG: hypothetical protein AAFX41_13295, partial [Bacteroidota bacterium]